VERRTAEVRVHNQHTLAALREDRASLKTVVDLPSPAPALTTATVCELVVLAREKEVGAQDAIGFRMGAFGAFVEQQADILRMTPSTGIGGSARRRQSF